MISELKEEENISSHGFLGSLNVEFQKCLRLSALYTCFNHKTSVKTELKRNIPGKSKADENIRDWVLESVHIYQFSFELRQRDSVIILSIPFVHCQMHWKTLN
ncbi:CLUMA_CG013710, isoform A [Clunio marinus]|uniref:CLUMA_CG013710, isoform A n=1 Tax=Clunio marinus TaxID=568069 RepID=A0A1J1IJM3_9DIPT|nr:CLUMA_CG013710, isoform A [Clunio marinus]